MRLTPFRTISRTADLLPAEQLVDAGYVSAKRILHSREAHAIDLIGPVHIDPSWQARTPGALDLSHFTVDWQHEHVTCPQGQHSVGWHRAKDAKGESVVQVLFAKAVCQACPLRSAVHRCPGDGTQYDAALPQERHEMLLAARQRQQTEAFKALYRLRAGIEGTFSQTTRNTGVRRARYRGLPKTHLQHVAHRSCDQSPASGCLAAGCALCQDTHLTLRCSRRLVLSSPTVSN